MVEFTKGIGGDPVTLCLSSHTSRAGRSAAEWKAFCSEERGPDVIVFGVRNRLDIVVKYPDKEGGSIGVEVKCLGNRGHAAKLTQGIGQALLALAHRDRTVLVIHCGTVPTSERDRLREIAAKVCEGSKMSIIVLP